MHLVLIYWIWIYMHASRALSRLPWMYFITSSIGNPRTPLWSTWWLVQSGTDHAMPCHGRGGRGGFRTPCRYACAERIEPTDIRARTQAVSYTTESASAPIPMYTPHCVDVYLDGYFAVHPIHTHMRTHTCARILAFRMHAIAYLDENIVRGQTLGVRRAVRQYDRNQHP